MTYEIVIGEHLPATGRGLKQGQTPLGYDRQRAVAYADFFCNRVCSDGFVMSNFRSYSRKAGQLLSEIEPLPSSFEGKERENDCTHFLSCCIGQPPTFTAEGGAEINGGGLFLDPEGFYRQFQTGVYGILNPSPLMQYLRLTQKVAFAHIDNNGKLSFDPNTPQFFDNNATQINQLKTLVQQQFPADKGKGDMVIYFRDTTKEGTHAAILVNDNWGIACHTSSRCGAAGIDNVRIRHFVYMRFKQFKEQFFSA